MGDAWVNSERQMKTSEQKKEHSLQKLNYWKVLNTLWQREELLSLSNFYFCHNCFQKPSVSEASESTYMSERVEPCSRRIRFHLIYPFRPSDAFWTHLQKTTFENMVSKGVKRGKCSWWSIFLKCHCFLFDLIILLLFIEILFYIIAYMFSKECVVDYLYVWNN